MLSIVALVLMLRDKLDAIFEDEAFADLFPHDGQPALPPWRLALVTYLIGKTGAGKSTLLKNMVIQDLRSGAGGAVIDPHGDLVEDLLNYIPKHRTNQVVYFNPADLDWPPGLNILEAGTDQDKQLACSSLVSIFRHLWSQSWGPRTEYILYNTVAALMDYPESTLLDVYRMLIDAGFRRSVVAVAQHTQA